MRASIPFENRPDLWALFLRLGLGTLFVIGGSNKLSQLLDPSRETAIVTAYTSPHGYINQFFDDYLFSGRFGDWLDPWTFLTALSTFELAAGVALIAGILVRPLALVFAFMMWSFVFALPVVTAPGVTVTVDTFTAPAMLVQIRDIALSGMMFVLFNLGSGAFSIQHRVLGPGNDQRVVDWNSLGLLLRLSIAAPLLVGGAFAGLSGIQTFGAPGWVLFLVGILLASGTAVRVMGAVVAGLMVFYVGQKLNLDNSAIANLNGFKREVPFLAAGVVLFFAGGGSKFVAFDYVMRKWATRPLKSAATAEKIPT